MIRLGKLHHISSSRNLIVRAEVIPPLGATVLTDDSRKIGRISDVFGPKNTPFVSVRPFSDERSLQSLIGRIIFYAKEGERAGGRGSSGLRSIRAKRGGRVS